MFQEQKSRDMELFPTDSFILQDNIHLKEGNA